MQIVRTNSFILDSITYGGREEHYCTREQITPELIADIKRDIIEGKVFFVLVQTEDETEDQFQLEINKGLHGEKWLEIYIEHTDAEKIEHIFMYCDEKYIKHKRDFEGQKEFDQNIILKSSCCYDFNTAAEIFGKWTLTGMLNPGLWWHQWDDGEDHFELTEVY